MSVLKYKRLESKAEYINTAYEIYQETLQFLTRLSARYSRLLSPDIMKLASEILDHSEKANSIYPSDPVRKQAREYHLLEARASLMALDVHMTSCYKIMMTNPEGCFTTASGKSVQGYEAIKKLDKMAESLGEKIDKENGLLKRVLESDKKR